MKQAELLDESAVASKTKNDGKLATPMSEEIADDQSFKFEQDIEESLEKEQEKKAVPKKQASDVSFNATNQAKNDPKAKTMQADGLNSRNEPSLKSMPVTEGSNFSIPEDTGIKVREAEAAIMDEEYSLPQESQEEADEYSNEDFEAESPVKKATDKHAETKTEIRSPGAMKQES